MPARQWSFSPSCKSCRNESRLRDCACASDLYRNADMASGIRQNLPDVGIGVDIGVYRYKSDPISLNPNSDPWVLVSRSLIARDSSAIRMALRSYYFSLELSQLELVSRGSSGP
jgi:hypothetical protein